MTQRKPPAKDWRSLKGVVEHGDYYEVDTAGNVRNIITSIILKNSFGNYAYVTLCKDGSRRKYYIHRLVAQAFLENPLSKPHVNHIDGNKLNNIVSNLEWSTVSENSIHAYRTGLRDSAIEQCRKLGHEKGGFNKKKVAQYSKNGKLLNVFDSGCEASRQTGVPASTVSKHCRIESVSENWDTYFRYVKEDYNAQ